MLPTLEAIQSELFAKSGESSPLLSLQPDDLAEAWARCEDGRVLQHVAVVSGERINAVRAAMACVMGASTYERLYCGPYPTVVDAIRNVEVWLENPGADLSESLARNSQEISHWVKWTAGSSCAHAIADGVQLTHAVASGQLRHAPFLAANAVANAADAMVEDALRFEGSPEGAAVEARLRARALAYLTQVVREHVPSPAQSARELHLRWLAGWGAIG